MHEIVVALSNFAFIGYPLLGVGVVALLLAIVFQVSQSRGRTQVAAEYEEDPDSAPEIVRISRLRKTFLALTIICLILGAAIAAAPQWVSIV